MGLPAASALGLGRTIQSGVSGNPCINELDTAQDVSTLAVIYLVGEQVLYDMVTLWHLRLGGDTSHGPSRRDFATFAGGG